MIGVFLLILLGIFMFLVEFLLIPGITVAGIGGFILVSAGIYVAFTEHGTDLGLITLGITIVSSVIILAFSLRSRTWKNVMLNTNIDGKVNEGPEEGLIKAGDKGETLTRLAPVGKVNVNGIVMEAKSISGYVDPHNTIEVIKISGSQLIVKPVK
jgi:membrane-bound ClpP family serine protease